MTYVDGYVVAVPTANKDTYREKSKEVAAVFKEYGALKVVENWGDDVPEGQVTSFTMAVKREADETVVFSWVMWPSKEVRDEGMKKAMQHPLMQSGMDPELFDGKRMIFGGFETIVDE